MHYFYILYSKKLNRHYVGESVNALGRLGQHNIKYYSNAFTNTADDWELKLALECVNKENALKLERFTKRMKSRKFIEKIIGNPDILHDILKTKL